MYVIFTHAVRVGKPLSLKNSLHIPKDTKLQNINERSIISQTFHCTEKSFHISKDSKKAIVAVSGKFDPRYIRFQRGVPKGFTRTSPHYYPTNRGYNFYIFPILSQNFYIALLLHAVMLFSGKWRGGFRRFTNFFFNR